MEETAGPVRTLGCLTRMPPRAGLISALWRWIRRTPRYCTPLADIPKECYLRAQTEEIVGKRLRCVLGKQLFLPSRLIRKIQVRSTQWPRESLTTGQPSGKRATREQAGEICPPPQG